jgi:ataxia telangiectasia mutated family protein
LSLDRYRPYDLKLKNASDQLKLKGKECNHRTEPMLALFLDIRAKLKPVMRHYFTERSKNPISWFSMRLNYTRSVATTSIVGHILGLGDRHSSNILMDNVTGEVVHIDLGVAFDQVGVIFLVDNKYIFLMEIYWPQGKLLSVPERIPFRMTADIVDGMGISGTQGVFQRCAEETLRVLRDDSEVIMTVLEVFKHDPLHSWSVLSFFLFINKNNNRISLTFRTANELKIKRVPGTPLESTANDAVRLGIIGIDMTSGGAEEAADRALTSVARKLNKALSVEYTVNELIAEATDLTNLATLWYGESV